MFTLGSQMPGTKPPQDGTHNLFDHPQNKTFQIISFGHSKQDRVIGGLHSFFDQLNASSGIAQRLFQGLQKYFFRKVI